MSYHTTRQKKMTQFRVYQAEPVEFSMDMTKTHSLKKTYEYMGASINLLIKCDWVGCFEKALEGAGTLTVAQSIETYTDKLKTEFYNDTSKLANVRALDGENKKAGSTTADAWGQIMDSLISSVTSELANIGPNNQIQFSESTEDFADNLNILNTSVAAHELSYEKLSQSLSQKPNAWTKQEDRAKANLLKLPKTATSLSAAANAGANDDGAAVDNEQKLQTSDLGLLINNSNMKEILNKLSLDGCFGIDVERHGADVKYKSAGETLGEVQAAKFNSVVRGGKILTEDRTSDEEGRLLTDTQKSQRILDKGDRIIFPCNMTSIVYLSASQTAPQENAASSLNFSGESVVYDVNIVFEQNARTDDLEGHSEMLEVTKLAANSETNILVVEANALQQAQAAAAAGMPISYEGIMADQNAALMVDANSDNVCPVGSFSRRLVQSDANSPLIGCQVVPAGWEPALVNTASAVAGATDIIECGEGKFTLERTAAAPYTFVATGDTVTTEGSTPGLTDASALVLCVGCASGHVTAQSNIACAACAEGSFQSAVNGSSCDLCPAGKYINSTGQDVCTDNTTGNQTQSTDAEFDVAKYVKLGATHVAQCNDGKFNSQTTGPCIDVQGGFQGQKSSTGNHVADGSNQEVACANGTFNTDGAGECDDVAAGKQGTNENGTYILLAATHATPCVSGRFNENGNLACGLIGAGKQGQISDSGAEYTATGAIYSVACAQGFFQLDGSGACARVSAGKQAQESETVGGVHATTLATHEVNCTNGKYNNVNTGACEDIDSGKQGQLTETAGEPMTTPFQGAFYEVNCVNGKFNADGNGECDKVPAGSQGEATGTVGTHVSSGASASVLCAISTFNGDGDGPCVSFTAGHYLHSEGPKKCLVTEYNVVSGANTATNSYDVDKSTETACIDAGGLWVYEHKDSGASHQALCPLGWFGPPTASGPMLCTKAPAGSTDAPPATS